MIFVHVHYPDVWAVMSKTLAAHMTLPFRLVVTAGPDVGDLAFPETRHLSSTTVMRTENRGRDILPFLRAYAATDGYEIGLKLHTKRSDHRLEGGLWRDAILASLLPPPPTTGRIVAAMRADDRVAFAAPDRSFLAVAPWVNRNWRNMRRIAGLMGMDLEKSMLEDTFFAAGSMFWFRRSAFAGLADPRLLTIFEDERGQRDGTMAHAFERFLAVEASRRGRIGLTVEALLETTPSTPRAEMAALARRHADAAHQLPQQPARFVRLVDRCFPFAAAIYRRMPAAWRVRLREHLRRR